MKIIVLTSLMYILFFIRQSSAQNLSDSIVFKIVKKEEVYFFHEKRLSKKQLIERLKTNKLAFKEVEGRKTEKLVENIFAYGGISLLLYSVAHYILSGNFPLLPAFTGTTLTLFSIPITISNKNNIYRAVRIYNRTLSE